MYLLKCLWLAFGLAVIGISAYKSDTWPPKELNEDCDIEGSIKLCHERCKVDLGEVKRFELSTDLGNLPNSQELKCYLYCFMESCGVFQKNSTRLNLEFVMNKIEKLPREKQDIVFGMAKGCVRRSVHIKDPFEKAYAMNVCTKENDNEHYYMFY